MLYRLSYAHEILLSMEHEVGVEPTTFGLRDRCSGRLSYTCMEWMKGIEPSTFDLARRRSTG